jgi:hypothetical protein
MHKLSSGSHGALCLHKMVSHLMLYRGKISGYFEDHTKQLMRSVNTMEGFSMLKQVVHKEALEFEGLIFTRKWPTIQ